MVVGCIVHLELVVMTWNKLLQHLISMCMVVVGHRRTPVCNQHRLASRSSIRESVNSCSKMLKGLVVVI